MANVLLNDTITDQDQAPVAGALAYVYDGTGLATLYDAMGQEVDNPVTTDEDGYWEAWVPEEKYYTTKYYWSGRLRYTNANILAGNPPVGPNSDPNVRSDLASTDPGKGADIPHYSLNVTDAADQTVRDKLVRQVETRDFGDKTRSFTNWTSSKSHRVEGYALDLRETGAAFDDSTDDTAALQDGIDWIASKGGGVAYLPQGTARVTELVVPSSVILQGAGGHIGASVLRGTALTGPVVRISGRSAGVRGVQIASTTERLASATPGDLAHGIHATRGDIAGLPTMSRLLLEDVYVINQPRDGVHITGQIEHSRFDTVTVADCKRHGFALDDGTRAGYTNKTYAFFMLKMDRCRAIECGGNALLAGKSGQTNQPSNLILDHFEALGCCWDSTVREVAQQIALYNLNTLMRNPDIEDQQYDQTATSSTGMTRTGNAAPAEGILCAASGVDILVPYFSSLTKSIAVNASLKGIRVVNPLIFVGDYGVAQAVAVTVGGSGTEIEFIGTTQSGATKLLECTSTLGNVRIDGVPRVMISSASFDGGIRNPAVPEQATISGGTLTVPSLNVVVRGEGAVADTLNTFRYVSGINGIGGHVARLHYGGEDITISNAGDFLFKGGATSLVLDATYPVATFVYNTSAAKWVEQ